MCVTYSKDILPVCQDEHEYITHTHNDIAVLFAIRKQQEIHQYTTILLLLCHMCEME